MLLRNLWRMLNAGYSLERGPAAHPSQSAFDRLPPSTRGVFAGLFSDAVARGFTGTDTSLADQFLEQFERARVIAADLEAISHDNSWRQILVEISKFGGINLAKEAKGFPGEVAWLMESLRWQARRHSPRPPRRPG